MPSTTFLFWNTYKKPLDTRIARIVAARDVDVVMLAESGSEPAETCAVLEAAGCGKFRPADGSTRGLALLTRLPRPATRLMYEDELRRWLIYHVWLPNNPPLILTVAHLPSRLHMDGRDQANVARALVEDIQTVEGQLRTDRTVVSGDLNMNPFDEGVSAADGLHGIMDRAVITRLESRAVFGQTHRMFYNPMWGLAGDRSVGPPGTYYRAASHVVNYYWNTYDQVLLRPGLMHRLSAVEVLTTDGVDGLLTAGGLPDKTRGSDHLPLLFRLDG